MNTEQTHAEALRLAENEVLELILSDLDTEARDALVATPAEHTDRIRDHQAMARAVLEIRHRIAVLTTTTAPKATTSTV